MPFAIARFVSVGILAILLAGPAMAEKRVALVIGNSAYENAPLLPNPKNDAADVAAMLEQLGFDVTLLTDQGYQGMRVALGDFSDKASGADVAAIFYAGHGIEVDKQNFLIPVDAKLGTDRRVRFETIPLDDALLALEGAKGLQLVMLDACRDNPFATAMKRTGATRSIGRGLARIEPEGSSVLVAYAAKEGQVAADGDGRNSPFTKALLGALPTPGLEIGILFRQVTAAVMADTGRAQQPFVYQSLGAEPIYLVPPGQSPSPAPQESSKLTALPKEPKRESTTAVAPPQPEPVVSAAVMAQIEDYNTAFRREGIDRAAPNRITVQSCPDCVPFIIDCRQELSDVTGLKGKHVRVGMANNEGWTLVEQAGGRPVGLPFGEVRTAFERGIIDCVVFGGGAPQ
ncbi:MAG: caspase family protein [Propylenella sp.]